MSNQERADIEANELKKKMEAEEADLAKLKQQAEAVSNKIEAEKALMSKKPELTKTDKVDIKALMEYSDKQVDKSSKSMETKA